MTQTKGGNQCRSSKLVGGVTRFGGTHEYFVVLSPMNISSEMPCSKVDVMQETSDTRPSLARSMTRLSLVAT